MKSRGQEFSSKKFMEILCLSAAVPIAEHLFSNINIANQKILILLGFNEPFIYCYIACSTAFVITRWGNMTTNLSEILRCSTLIWTWLTIAGSFTNSVLISLLWYALSHACGLCNVCTYMSRFNQIYSLYTRCYHGCVYFLRYLIKITHSKINLALLYYSQWKSGKISSIYMELLL